MKNKKSIFSDNYIKNTIFITGYLFAIEILFRALSKFDIFDYAVLRILISNVIISMIIVFLSSLTKKKWLRNAILLLFIFIYSLYAWLQIGFINYLGVYISFNTSSQFGAVKDYITDYLLSFKFSYYLIFTPFIAALIDYLVINKKREYKPFEFKWLSIILIPLLIIFSFLYYKTLTINFMQNKFQVKSNVALFQNPDVPTVAVNQFGTTVFGLLDLKVFLFPQQDDQQEILQAEIEKVDTTRKVSEALENIAKEEKDKKYSNLHNYFLSQKVNDYNDYTGMFAGKNVVVILMESVNEAIINEEYYPNFTKLYNEGWSWENTYSPRNSCATGNNEFSAMSGLYSIYNSCTANVYQKNKYFQAIFNLFNDAGYTTSSMHNFSEWYYYRSTIHPNMGSNKYYGAKDLGIKTAGYYGEWPSDIEFFEKAFDILLNEQDKPFMTWLTTVSSHQPYSSSSTYGDLYKKDFQEMGYSPAVSRYLSKLKVVDEAIGVMINKLTEAGQLDNTVIVMLADHYPYGLNKNNIASIIHHDLDDYDIEKTPFVIYNSQMEKKTFTDYNSYINLIPTVANLMGLEYDPRLYMGTDLLSDDYVSRVIFADGSWKNEKAYYDASTSKLKYYTEEVYTTEEIQEINKEVNLKIDMSARAIKNNYFNYLNKKITEYEESLKKEEVENVKEENIYEE